MHVAADPFTSRRARDAVQRLLGDDPPIKFIRDAILLTSELVSNAVHHAPGDCVLAASYWRAPERLRVEVADGSPLAPEIVSSRGRGQGGLGLQLVATVSDRWGWERKGPGKVVWFEIDVPPVGHDASQHENIKLRDIAQRIVDNSTK
ncbi:MAG: hypothetical protein JWN62_2490 [Acidimicrobiales bacterium]|nr:hypothetical protein [Acidimicrobiales bacterium]